MPRLVWGLAALMLGAMPAAAQDLTFTEILDKIDGRWAPLHESCASAAFEIRLAPDKKLAEFSNWPVAGARNNYRVLSMGARYFGKLMTQPAIALYSTPGSELNVLRMPKADMIAISSIQKKAEPEAIFVRCMADQ